MANTFKNSFLSVNTGYQTLYTCTGSGKTTVILGLALCNKSANPVTVTVQIEDDSASNADFQILEQVSIPARTTLEVLAGQKYILEEDDLIRVLASAAEIDATLGIMEIT